MPLQRIMRPTQPAKMAGFTLLELLLVLFLIGLGSAIVGPRISGFLSGNETRRVSDLVENRLNLLRTQAVLGGKVQKAEINIVSNVLRDATGDLVVPEQWHFEPVPELQIAGTAPAASADEEIVDDPDLILLRFNPDGTAKAVHFNLIGPEQTRLGVSIIALTGRIRIQPLEAANAS